MTKNNKWIGLISPVLLFVAMSCGFGTQTVAAHSPQASSYVLELPDRAAMKREETRRWDLTKDHRDLPIRQTDPNASE
jgi:hypothetical protein